MPKLYTITYYCNPRKESDSCEPKSPLEAGTAQFLVFWWVGASESQHDMTYSLSSLKGGYIEDDIGFRDRV